MQVATSRTRRKCVLVTLFAVVCVVLSPLISADELGFPSGIAASIGVWVCTLTIAVCVYIERAAAERANLYRKVLWSVVSLVTSVVGVASVLAISWIVRLMFA